MRFEPVTVRAEGLQILRRIIVTIPVNVVYIQLTRVKGDETAIPAPISLVLLCGLADALVLLP